MNSRRLRRLAAAFVALVAASGLLPPSGASFSDTTDATGSSFSAATLGSVFRVTTYELRPGVFTGASYDVPLADPLAADYFVVMRGGAGNGSTGGNRSPNANYARVTGDPHGNFAVATGASQLRIARTSETGDWQGQVTVVESLADAAGSGFRLVDVVETSMAAGVGSVSSSSTPGWSDLGRVGLYGGIRGGGVATTTANRNHHNTGWATIVPSGANTLTHTRQAGGGGQLSGTTTFTTYVVEWGADWTIQRATVAGTGGGGGSDQTGNYVMAAIAPVNRASTFLLGYGRTADNGLGDGWEGQLFTLGDGVTQNTTESQVAVSAQYADNRTALVYVHSHPDLAVDHRFGTYGGSGIPSTAASGTFAVDPPAAAEVYDNAGSLRSTSGTRFTVVTNSSGGTGTAYPRPMVWSRPTAATTATWLRSRTGQPGAVWLQSVDFAAIVD
jgi:hypothetical protein